MPSRRLVWIAALAIGCSGNHKPPAAAGARAGTSPADRGAVSGCEPGRCLEDISRLVKERRAASRACYDAAAKQNPALPAGRIIINFRIDATGAVVETSQGMQDNQISDEGVVQCVGDVIETIRFAPSPAGKATRAYHEFEFARR